MFTFGKKKALYCIYQLIQHIKTIITGFPNQHKNLQTLAQNYTNENNDAEIEIKNHEQKIIKYVKQYSEYQLFRNFV